jgi:hypothetical protein
VRESLLLEVRLLRETLRDAQGDIERCRYFSAEMSRREAEITQRADAKVQQCVFPSHAIAATVSCDACCRYLRLNERQAAEIQRAIAAADDADAATSVARAQMERLRLQMDAQGAELAAVLRRLEETTEQLQVHQRSSEIRVLELQSQRDAMAKALRESRSEADTAARDAQEAGLRAHAMESALASMGQQVAEYESAKQAMLLQQQSLLQQQEEVGRRERAADESCRNFAVARSESQAAVTALKLELGVCSAQLQRAQGQLSMMGANQGTLQQLEEVLDRFKRRGKALSRVVAVRFALLILSILMKNESPFCCFLRTLGLTRAWQLSCSCAAVAACFAAWAKCLHQRRFLSLSSAAEAVQRQMHSIESMFNTKMSAVTSERDFMQEQLLVERDKVRCRCTALMRCNNLSVCAALVSACSSRLLPQVSQLERREAALKEHVAQLDKKLNDMQRVYMKGVKSTVDSIRAGRAVLGDPSKGDTKSGGEGDGSQ